MTNLFRQGVLASLRPRGEAEGLWPDRCAEVTEKATSGHIMWLRTGCPEGRAEQAERPGGVVRRGQESEPS